MVTALSYLDYGHYFDLVKTPQPTTAEGICHYLQEESIIAPQDNGLYAITKEPLI